MFLYSKTTFFNYEKIKETSNPFMLWWPSWFTAFVCYSYKLTTNNERSQVQLLPRAKFNFINVIKLKYLFQYLIMKTFIMNKIKTDY